MSALNPFYSAQKYQLNRLSQTLLAILLLCAGPLSHAQSSSSQNPTAEMDQIDEDEVAVLEAVQVTAHSKNDVSSGTLGARSDLDTPFSTYRVDSDQIAEQQAKTIAKLFEHDATVQAKGSSYGLDAYAISVRGLTLDFVNGYKIDGHPFQMYGVELPLEAFQEVQLLKGATGFLYGIGSPGGTVNYISKKPTPDPTAAVSIGYTSDSLFSQHFDIGGYFDQDKQFGYRFNAVNESGVAYNNTEVERQAFALYLSAQLRDDLDVYANGFYQRRLLEGGINTISVANSGSYAYQGSSLPKAIDGSKDLTAYDDAYYDSEAWGAATGFNWQLSDQWNLHGSYSHTFKRISSRDQTLYLRNEAGDYNLALRQYYRPTLNFDSVQLRLDGHFNTGWIAHHVVTGLDWQRQTRDLNIGNPNLDPNTSAGGQNHVYPTTGSYPSGNLYQPALDLVYDGDSPHRYFRISNWYTRSAYISDTLSFNPQWSLLLGLRKFDYENSNYYVSGNLRSEFKDSPLSPTAALLWSPLERTTVYASYVESLEDSGTVGSSYANAYEQLESTESKQYELGIKTDQQHWALTSALFRIERGTGYANSQNQYVVDGVARYDGIELSGHYLSDAQFKLLASAVWIDAQYTKAAASVVGKTPTAVARFQGTVGFEKTWSALEGLSVHGSFQHYGKQYVNNSNSLSTPSYRLVNIGASYRQSLGGQKQLIYRAQINNLFDQDYWVASSNALAQGAPRTISLNLQYQF
jgi:iron complex outermembrane receptor protein